MRTRTALSAAWLAVGAGCVVWSELVYGWRSRVIDHAWHLAAYLVLMSWMLGGRMLERRHRRERPRARPSIMLRADATQTNAALSRADDYSANGQAG